MKFARYLEDTQTPEWKKAYMDYRLLKKRISAIRNERREFEDVSDTPTASRISLAPSVPYTSDQHGTASLHGQGGGRATSLDVTAGGDSGRPSNATARTSVVSMPETLRSEQDTTPVLSGSGSGARQATLGKRLGATRGMLRRNKTNLWRPSKSLSLSTSQLPPSSLPFVELYDSLSPAERAFFDALQGELDKVEAFYLRQEQEMRVRFFKLQKQLEELGKHRKAFHQTFDTTRHSPWPLNPLSDTVKIKRGRIKIYKEHDQIPDAPMLRRELSTPHYGPGSVGSTSPKGLGSSPKGAFNVNGKGKSPEEGLARVDENGESQGKRGKRDSFNGSTSLGEDGSGIPALKKFEKNTGIPAQLTWMAEKIDSGVLGSGASVRSMLSDMEMLFTEKFEHGNKKQALSRLRAHSSTKTHHFSTFSTGLAVGLAIPALIDGIRESALTPFSVH
ncbi:SPX domain-containing protein [Pterulicium gracile]|uniref:SPX domain-containing protein n=1 Tax=Pterulicium gracile TaxID=1884261 RepID=A0A5C3QT02_9AGAR|nr:SPX domain-containing protein [Pterula gracilis]